MGNHYHILNGDSLKEQFPEELEGEIIVTRECLVDGDVKSDSIDELFKVRARFISKFYGDYSTLDYYRDTVSEFERIRNIPEGSSVNLWFEDDLFCQVNFWFIVNLLDSTPKDFEIYLVRPKIHTRFGFGGLDKAELKQIFLDRIRITNMDKITKLWEFYKKGDLDNLVNTAQDLEDTYPFILDAVDAHIERIPTKDHPGRPVQTLLEIMKEIKTEEFGPVFQEFCKREFIYGFGDLQVKKLIDEINNSY